MGARALSALARDWLRRLAENDEVLAPGTGNDPVQYVDVRDVAAWIVDCVESERVGTYNPCGPGETLTFRSFLEGARSARRVACALGAAAGVAGRESS